jgi:2-oxoglutarate/2-oxoacid ferredoxin oxidoreductase subunit beta
MADIGGSERLPIHEFSSPVEIAWCPGCGNFGILRALKQALVELQLKPAQVLVVSGIGQAGKTPHYLKCNTFNGLHGRSLPAAAGARLANRDLTVIAEGGDGDGYGEGGNHLIGAISRNIKITYLVHNNQVYALTKGQASPTSAPGFVTKTTPGGAGEALNPIALAIALNASFVARSYAGDAAHLSGMIKAAIQHRGFALLDILQPCVTFNRVNTYQFYQARLYKLEDDRQYDPANRVEAFRRSLEWGDKIPIGIFYRHERPLFEDTHPVLKEKPLVNQVGDIAALKKFVEEFK